MSKKNFKDNPALHFISPPAASESAPEAAGPLKPNYLYVETKSRRVQLLLQPSLHKKLKQAADRGGRSFNDLVHEVLNQWALENLKTD